MPNNHPNIIAFERASGIPHEVLISNRSTLNVDLRDLFVYLNANVALSIPETMELLGRDRTSYYASKNRFKNRYAMYADYRDRVSEIKLKISGQLELF